MNERLLRIMADLHPEDSEAIQRFLRELTRSGYLNNISRNGYAIRVKGPDVGTKCWYNKGELSEDPYMSANLPYMRTRAKQASLVLKDKIEGLEIVELTFVELGSIEAGLSKNLLESHDLEEVGALRMLWGQDD